MAESTGYLSLPLLVKKFLQKQDPQGLSDHYQRYYGLGNLNVLQRTGLGRRQEEEPVPEPISVTVMGVSVFHSATAKFTSANDPTGRFGVHSEVIRANPSWHKSKRYDCVLVNEDPLEHGLDGMHIARVLLFFSFSFAGKTYTCALIRWFIRSSEDGKPDPLTGMWVVEPEYNVDRTPSLAVIDIDTIYRSAHLIPVFPKTSIPYSQNYSETLDNYENFYVNKYADINSHELLHVRTTSAQEDSDQQPASDGSDMTGFE